MKERMESGGGKEIAQIVGRDSSDYRRFFKTKPSEEFTSI
jgi:hypothetical protein